MNVSPISTQQNYVYIYVYIIANYMYQESWFKADKSQQEQLAENHCFVESGLAEWFLLLVMSV